MTNTLLSKRQIAEQLLRPYINDPSLCSYTVDDEGDITCLYNGPNGKHCGFASACVNPEKDLLEYEFCAASEILKHSTAKILRAEYRHLHTAFDFWDRLQAYHDVLAARADFNIFEFNEWLEKIN